MEKHHVILVPGFFGFGHLGGIAYFLGVREVLDRHFERLDLNVEVNEVTTLPTASIRHRAARVLETINTVAARHDGPIHLVGHSTGGLDARLAIAPTASLPTDVIFDAYERVRTLVTVSTPHFGTPLAAFFGSAAGKPLLKVLAVSMIFILRRGRIPVRAVVKLGEVISRLDDYVGLRRTVLDELYEKLLGEFTLETQKEIIEFIDGISRDQSLIFQLTSAGCDLLNASTADPDAVRYGSVVAAGRRPRLRGIRRQGHDVYAQTMHFIYAWLYLITSRSQRDWIPAPTPEQDDVIVRAFGRSATRADNDGIVPTLSQVWGEVIHATRADHLDVVGHFGRTGSESIDVDWLPSGTAFDEAEFERMWGNVARFIVEDAVDKARPRRSHRVGRDRTEFSTLQPE
ncbi:MAG: esterase/lipase family protein [Myxococcota bacterium]